jgi:ProP effector
MSAARDQNVGAVLELLAEKWPACFSIYEQRRRPLKVGIHVDIVAVLDGAVTPTELSRALKAYASNKVYRARLSVGATRIDLAGEPAGVVTAAEAEHAVDKLAELKTTKKAALAATRSHPPPAEAPPKKLLSLADLRIAARLRKEAAAS